MPPPVAARTGSATVQLDDGSSGLLPEEWRAREPFAALERFRAGDVEFRGAGDFMVEVSLGLAAGLLAWRLAQHVDEVLAV